MKRLPAWSMWFVFALLAGLVGWQVAKQAKVAELKLSIQRQPRAEVVVSGFVCNVGATAFSLETLTIEEPGKPPYPRQVALDADRKFELALGEPRPGKYRVGLQTRTATLSGRTQERWLRVPELANAAGNPQEVSVQDYDDRTVTGYAAAVVVVGVLLAIYSYRPAARHRSTA